VTVTLGLTVIDLAVLIYFIHHTAISIQLPQVIASIAADLADAIKEQGSDPDRGEPENGPTTVELVNRTETSGAVLLAPVSGYVQFIKHQNLVRLATEADALSAAVNDTFTAMTCIDWLGENLCKIVAGWHPARVHRDAQGYIRVISAEPSYDRLVQRSFEKIRQSSQGMPAVMIRELEALARIMTETTSEGQRRVLLEQAAMIDRASERSVPEAADRADIRRRYEAILTMESRLTASGQNA